MPIELNKAQQGKIKLLQTDLIVHLLQDNGEVYITLAHEIRMRLDSKGNILSAWVDRKES